MNITCLTKQNKDKLPENSNISLTTKLGNAIIQNISENSSTYAETFKSILEAWKDCSVKTRDLELELKNINNSHNNKLAEIDKNYEKCKNGIDNLIEQSRDLQKKLDKIDINNLTEEGHTLYRELLNQINNTNMTLIQLYDKVL